MMAYKGPKTCACAGMNSVHTWVAIALGLEAACDAQK